MCTTNTPGMVHAVRDRLAALRANITCRSFFGSNFPSATSLDVAAGDATTLSNEVLKGLDEELQGILSELITASEFKGKPVMYHGWHFLFAPRECMGLQACIMQLCSTSVTCVTAVAM